MTVEVDTLRLRGPLRDSAALRALTHWRMVRGEAGEGHVVSSSDVLPSGARVSVDLRNDGIPEAAVEFSAPKVGAGSNVYAMPLREAVDVARAVWDEAGTVVGWADKFEDARVQRVDVDRDFCDVTHAGPLLAALSKVRAAWNPGTRYFPDPDHGNAATLTRGAASRWLATLYDKHGESLHRARHATAEHREAAAREVRQAEGRLRYELRLRSDVLGPAGVRTVRHLFEDDGERALIGMRRSYFDRVGYGLEVTGMARAAELVMEHDELRVNSRLALIGWLFLERENMPADLSRNRAADYRKRAAAIGVTPEDLDELVSTSVRLDFERGVMATRAA